MSVFARLAWKFRCQVLGALRDDLAKVAQGISEELL
jgi:hypothetical protein